MVTLIVHVQDKELKDVLQAKEFSGQTDCTQLWLQDEPVMKIDPTYFKAEALHTSIVFYSKPSEWTHKRHTRCFIRMSVFQDGTRLFASSLVPLLFCSSKDILVRRAYTSMIYTHQKDKIECLFKNTSPTIPFLTLTYPKSLICSHLPDLFPSSKPVSFYYKLSTGEITSKIQCVQ